MPPETSKELTALLSGGTWRHDNGITFEASRAFGLDVRRDILADVVRLMSLFLQPKRRGLESLPVPYRCKERQPPRGER
jgi:serine dehydrogenase proteinase